MIRKVKTGNKRRRHVADLNITDNIPRNWSLKIPVEALLEDFGDEMLEFYRQLCERGGNYQQPPNLDE